MQDISFAKQYSYLFDGCKRESDSFLVSLPLFSAIIRTIADKYLHDFLHLSCYPPKYSEHFFLLNSTLHRSVSIYFVYSSSYYSLLKTVSTLNRDSRTQLIAAQLSHYFIL